MRGHPPKARTTRLGECSRNPLYQGTSWHCCERLHWVSVNLFVTGLPITWWVNYEHTCSHGAECSARFDKKTPGSLCPTLPVHPILSWVTFFLFPWMKTSPQREKGFAHVEEVEKKPPKPKTAEALNREVQKVFWAVEKCLHRCTASNGESLKVTEV